MAARSAAPPCLAAPRASARPRLPPASGRAAGGGDCGAHGARVRPRGGGGEGSGASQGLIPLSRGGNRRDFCIARPGQPRPGPAAAAIPSRKRGQVQAGPAAVPGPGPHPAAGPAGRGRSCRVPTCVPPAGARQPRLPAEQKLPRGLGEQRCLPGLVANPLPVELCRG